MNPTREELVAIRQKLLTDIEEAEQLITSDPRDLCALNTVRRGLELIEELLNNARILAVIDQNVIASQIGASLQESSYRVTFPGTFSKAIKILKSERIDLIISDIRMQDDNSDCRSVFNFLRWVKSDPLLRVIPFVCISTEILNQTYIDGIGIAARSLGANFLRLDVFDPISFRKEIESLLRLTDEKQVGSHR